MRAFVFACVGAIAIAIIGAVALGSIQESADQAFSTSAVPWSVKPYVRLWPKADMAECTAHVRFWGQSGHDFVRKSAFAVAIGGKADMAFCGANVRL
jgi:hypothetical protein